MANYQYIKVVDLDRLSQEIAQSSIVTALDHIQLDGSDTVTVVFKADLSDADKATLDGIMAAHSGQPLPDLVGKPVSVINMAKVQTQFERTDLDLKISCLSADVNTETGQAELSIKCPGTPGSAEGRYLSGGEFFFDEAHAGDRVTTLNIVDVDGILGQGPEFLIKTYHDDEIDAVMHGWFVPPKRGQIDIETLGFYGFLPAGLYLEVYAQKAPGHYAGKAYCNIFWGKST